MYKTNFNKAVHYLGNHYILCNNIVNVDLESIYENFTSTPEDDEFPEIYQWYISDCSDSDVKYLTEHFPGVLFTYSEKLELWILCVTHYGTSWNYVDWYTDLDIKA